MDEVVIIIPARYGSSRLPGKPLLKIGKKTIIQWTYEGASRSKLASRVLVATDDQRIADAVTGFGGEISMTSADHETGSDRIQEVASKLNAKWVVNVQGDEPKIDEQVIDPVIELLKTGKFDITTACTDFNDSDEAKSPHVVKVSIDENRGAKKFSRWSKSFEGEETYKHIGVYAYRRDALKKFTSLPQHELEKEESLEQLRALHNGMKMGVAKVESVPMGIDTLEDLERANQMFSEGRF